MKAIEIERGRLEERNLRYSAACTDRRSRATEGLAAITNRPSFALLVIVKPCRLPTLSDHYRRCELFGIPEKGGAPRLPRIHDQTWRTRHCLLFLAKWSRSPCPGYGCQRIL